MTTRQWFITGTTSGFGRTMCEILLARGDRVIATARKPALLDDLKALHGEALQVRTLDVTDADGVRRTIDEAFANGDRIDVIVSNAGYGLFGAGEEVSDAQIRQQIDTNLLGSMRVIRAALPHLRAQGGGRILQVSSEGGQIAYPNFSLYHASKWGIEGFIESVAQEVAPFGIEFTILEPGPAGTDFGRSLVSPPPMAEYDDTPAGEVRRAIASGAFLIKGDAKKMAHAMIDTVDRSPAPKRLALGTSSYHSIRAALLQRLALLDEQMDITCSTDRA